MSSRVLSSLLLGFGLLDAIDLGLVHDLDLEIAQLDVDLVQFLGRDQPVRQGVVDVVVGEISLLLRQSDQLFDFFGNVKGGLGFRYGRCLGRSSRMFGSLRARVRRSRAPHFMGCMTQRGLVSRFLPRTLLLGVGTCLRWLGLLRVRRAMDLFRLRFCHIRKLILILIDRKTK